MHHSVSYLLKIHWTYYECAEAYRSSMRARGHHPDRRLLILNTSHHPPINPHYLLVDRTPIS
jgi:hypothetical protein